jgi:hypothetical protein
VSVAVLVAVAVPVPVAVPVAVAVPVPVAVPVAVAVPVPVAVEDALRLVVGCIDFDGDAVGDVGTRLTPCGAELTVLPGRVALAEAVRDGADDEWDAGVCVRLLPFTAEPLLFDNSTATIAMTPTAAAPIPA